MMSIPHNQHQSPLPSDHLQEKHQSFQLEKDSKKNIEVVNASGTGDCLSMEVIPCSKVLSLLSLHKHHLHNYDNELSG